jgi:hypothetical protein
MIEERSDGASFLCITYDQFDQPESLKSASEVTLAYHLNQIARRILFGLLVHLDRNPELSKKLSEHQKQLLKFQVERFLGSLSAAEVQQAIDSLKNFGDKTREFLKKYGGPLKGLIQAALMAAGLGKVDVPAELLEEAKQDESLDYHYRHLLQIAQVVGFDSTYVLVDRVDEMPLTGDASTSAEFIWPLLADLRTLETPGGAIKFFLWDQVGPVMTERKFRTDRIGLDRLDWTLDELKKMLELRLATDSQGKVRSFNRLLCDEVGLDVHTLLARFANGSPRDMIRLSKRIVADQTRTSADQSCIEARSVWAGLRVFAEQRSVELFPEKYLEELKKVAKPTFTKNYLANTVFRINETNTRRKIQLWTDTGVIAKVGEKANPPNRPSYVYGVVDPRVAVAIRPATDVDVILATQHLICPQCDSLCVSDDPEINCPKCSYAFTVRKAKSLLEAITLKRAQEHDDPPGGDEWSPRLPGFE